MSELNNAVFGSSFANYGCVLFDVKELDGRGWIAVPGPGWASIDGEPAFRIRDTNELPGDIQWITNLDKKTFWEMGGAKQTKLKYSGYLRTELHQILREMGVHPKYVPVSKSAEAMSEIFARTLRLSAETYGIREFTSGDLHDDIRNYILPIDKSISLEVDEVMSRSFQDYVTCERQPLRGGKHVTFRRPRRLHAEQILESPVPGMFWEFIPQDKLPNERVRLDWLLSLDRPVVAKVAIKGFYKRTQSSVDVSKLLIQGEAMAAGGKKKERNWMTHSELLYLAKFAQLDIQAAFLADKYEVLSMKTGLQSGETATHLSMSSGLIAENHWVALASRSKDPTTKSKTLVSPRAAWLRAADRFYCFAGAVMMAGAGFPITSYGVGGVNVFVPDGELSLALSVAREAGLLSPGSLYTEAKKENECR